jgi:hypothetical protein
VGALGGVAAMNVLLLLAHSIAEYDDMRMFTDMGVDVFSIGAYTDPRHPGDTMRPPLPDAPWHPELAALVAGDQMRHKEHLPDELIEWADVIIAHHYVREWLLYQWPRIKHKRVVWRTCGQSDPSLEAAMTPLRAQGLQIVRYSPAERRYFEGQGIFAGEDALIRFGKYPEDWGGWTGEDAVVGNLTQNMAQRGEHVGLPFWLAATEGLPVRPAGPGSEQLRGGIGALDYQSMREYLRRCRAYLYTGTIPASYTLGLIEAMLTGTPVVSIGPKTWGKLAHPDLFEGDELAHIDPITFAGGDFDPNEPAWANLVLQALLNDADGARVMSHLQRQRAIDLFDVRKVREQWAQFLGVTVRQAVTA